MLTAEKWDRSRAYQLNAQVLAFIGDAVHTLAVRTKLVSQHDNKSGALHTMATGEVSAVAQAKHYDRVAALLTEEEQAIFRRGRNANVKSMAKNASAGEYMKATGFEAVLGFLYLVGEQERLLELISK